MSLTGKEVAQMHKDYVMQSWARSGADTLPVERAEGIYFYDYDGKKYADMASLLAWNINPHFRSVCSDCLTIFLKKQECTFRFPFPRLKKITVFFCFQGQFLFLKQIAFH